MEIRTRIATAARTIFFLFLSLFQRDTLRSSIGDATRHIFDGSRELPRKLTEIESRQAASSRIRIKYT